MPSKKKSPIEHSIQDSKTQAPPVELPIEALETLFEQLKQHGYDIIGPRLENGVITLGPISEVSELPRGVIDEQQPGHYRLQPYAPKFSDQQQEPPSSPFFSYAVGPHSLKKLLMPARRRLWQASQTAIDEPMTISMDPVPTQKIALFGIRGCDIAALKKLDDIYLTSTYQEPYYAAVRSSLLLITATCIEPSRSCFCTSMEGGPYASNYDLNLTEVHQADAHHFIAQAGSDLGAQLLGELKLKSNTSSNALTQQHNTIVDQATAKIKRYLNTDQLAEKLRNRLEHNHWQTVADRCLACGNCTLVCPTCFCSTTEDHVDLTGDHSERWLRWDSCFTQDFSYLHGGAVRDATRARYRQWLTHKLSSWHDQFDTSGCVGCGRCITWCPVGIDLTQEIPQLLKDDNETT